MIMKMVMAIMIMEMVTTRPFYPPAGLHQLGANHCPGFGPAPQSGIWSKHYILGKRTCQIRDNNNNEQSSTQRQEHQQKYLVISVPPSSAGGLQLTSTLSWKTSVTLQVNGGVGLSGGKVSEAMPTIIFTHDVDVDVPFVAALGVADDHLGGSA